MSRYSDTILDSYGRPVPGASVYVYDIADPDAPVLETLTDDAADPLENPLTTDQFGAFYFNADDGEKRIDVWFEGARRWREDVLVGPIPEGPKGDTGDTGPAGPTRLIYPTWAALNAVATKPAGTVAEVPLTDVGTHVDPVVGGNVGNSGVFRYSAAPAGWERIADVDAVTAGAIPAWEAMKDGLGVINLFDPAARVVDNLMAGGALAANAGFFVTGFIPVQPGGFVTSSQAPSGLTPPYGTQFFDANKVFISSPGVFAANTPMAVPANAYYMRASYHMTANPIATLMISRGNALPAEYLGFGLMPRHRPATIAERISSRSRLKTENLYDKERRTADSLVSADNGAITAFAGYFATDYFPVTPGGSITITASSGLTWPWGLAFYDEDFVYVSGVAAPFTDGQVVAVPATAFFCRTCDHSVHVDSLIILNGNQAVQHHSLHTPATISDTSQWTGKGLAILGDSISINFDWLAVAAPLLQATVGLRAAVVGRTMADAMKDEAGVALDAADFANVAAVIIWLGTNDAGVTALGTLADSTATATFYGRTKLAVETIIGFNDAIRIILATPLQKTGGYATLTPYAQAIRDVAGLYALPVIDFFKAGSVNDANLDTLTSDGLHPNANGYYRAIIPTVLGALRGIYPAI